MAARIACQKADTEVRPALCREDATLAFPQGVLIVDRSEENRQVLETALTRRGLRTWTAGRMKKGLELAGRHHPDLVVLDLETVDAADGDAPVLFLERNSQQGAPVIVLGTCCRTDGSRLGGEFVAKPYHYGPLIRKIEQLLDAAERNRARAA
jgi:DNA-binding response OmpR family regulator